MNDKQIVEYCKKLIKANLNQYIDTGDIKLIVGSIYNLENDKTNKELLEHCYGLKALLEKCIEILEKRNKKNEV